MTSIQIQAELAKLDTFTQNVILSSAHFYREFHGMTIAQSIKAAWADFTSNKLQSNY